jgi:hypothetical protein
LRQRKPKSSGRRARTTAEPSRSRQTSPRAADFIELATEAAGFRQLPDFLENFSRRTAQILSADWCGVVVFNGGRSELHSAVSALEAGLDEAALLARSANALRQKTPVTGGTAGSAKSGDASLFIIPVRAGSGEALGAICVYRAPLPLLQRESKLLRALANHAAL